MTNHTIIKKAPSSKFFEQIQSEVSPGILMLFFERGLDVVYTKTFPASPTGFLAAEATVEKHRQSEYSEDDVSADLYLATLNEDGNEYVYGKPVAQYEYKTTYNES
jgi:hypothetical protein